MRVVIPAPGRDFTTSKAVRAAWRRGDAFAIDNPASPWHGRPINSAEENGPVKIRYAGRSKETVIAAVGVVS